MLSLIAYAIYVGIVKHVQHYKNKEATDTAGGADQRLEQDVNETNDAAQHSMSQVALPTSIKTAAWITYKIWHERNKI